MVHLDHCHGCGRSGQELAASGRVDPAHEADGNAQMTGFLPVFLAKEGLGFK